MPKCTEFNSFVLLMEKVKLRETNLGLVAHLRLVSKSLDVKQHEDKESIHTTHTDLSESLDTSTELGMHQVPTNIWTEGRKKRKGS